MTDDEIRELVKEEIRALLDDPEFKAEITLIVCYDLIQKLDALKPDQATPDPS